jgi:hypothetical protein
MVLPVSVLKRQLLGILNIKIFYELHYNYPNPRAQYFLILILTNPNDENIIKEIKIYLNQECILPGKPRL